MTCPPVVASSVLVGGSARGGHWMTSRAEKTGKALSLLIVVAMVAGGLFAIALALAPRAQAGTCDQVAPVINGNWVITTAQVCTGISYSIDGQLYIRHQVLE